MIVLCATPSSIARFVCPGRHSMARRRSSIRRSRFDRIGSPTLPVRVLFHERHLAPMKLGVHIGYWGLGLSSEDQVEIVQEAERLGFDSVWTAEAYGSDAATILGWLAAQTSTIKLGSAIFQMPG